MLPKGLLLFGWLLVYGWIQCKSNLNERMMIDSDTDVFYNHALEDLDHTVLTRPIT